MIQVRLYSGCKKGEETLVAPLVLHDGAPLFLQKTVT